MRLPSRTLNWAAGVMLVLVAVMAIRTGRRPQAETAPQAAQTPAPAVKVHLATTAKPNVKAQEILARLQAPRKVAAPETLLAQLLDATQSEKTRATAGENLARLGTDEALAALRTVLVDASTSPTLKAALAEALGVCPHREARALLLKLAKGADETVARGAMRGLAAINDSVAVDSLVSFLNDEHTPASVRGEAARALGTVESPNAFPALKSAFQNAGDSTLAKDILEGMGQREFAETREFFNEFLRTPETPAHLRVAAMEAIGNSPSDTTEFLLSYTVDADPEARAAAAWALSFADREKAIGQPLVELLREETESPVRQRLYEALAREKEFDAATVRRLVSVETEPATRLAGYNALARAAATPENAQFFDQQAVPELQQTALTGSALQHRLASVVALQRAKTPGARAALAELSQSSADARVIKAAQGALAPIRTASR